MSDRAGGNGRLPTLLSVYAAPQHRRRLDRAPTWLGRRKLVAASGTSGQKVVVWTGPEPLELVIGHLAVATLNRLGYRATLKVDSE